MTHDDLVSRAVRWLRGTQKCGVVLAEVGVPQTSPETPDAIGWRYRGSILVECKTNRSDFHADKRKTFRRMPDLGMGGQRYFLTPRGLIDPRELPARWGLIEVRGRVVRVVQRAEPWSETERNMAAEIGLLVSAVKRAAAPEPGVYNFDPVVLGRCAP